MTHQMLSFSSRVLSSQGGGGVYVSGVGATVTFNDCQITSNTASSVSKQARSGLLAVCFALLTFYTTLVLLSLCFVGCRGCIDSGRRPSLLLLYFLLLLRLLLLLGQIHKVSGWVSE